MALLTAQEADRIISGNFRITGATSEALMAGWRSMVYAMLERLDLGSYQRDIIMLARDIVPMWSYVQPACTYRSDQEFSYPDASAAGPLSFFEELHRLALAVLLATPELPPRDESEHLRDVESISAIAEFADRHYDGIRRMMQSEDCSYVRCTAGTFMTAAGCCQTLLRITLGRLFAQQFQQEYDECLSAWTLAIPLVQENLRTRT